MKGSSNSLFMDDNFSSLQIYTERTLTAVTSFIKTEEGSFVLRLNERNVMCKAISAICLKNKRNVCLLISMLYSALQYFLEKTGTNLASNMLLKEAVWLSFQYTSKNCEVH